MAWKGRTDLEKEMRRANDRLRRLEASGIKSQAYNEALRQTRLAEGDPSASVPRFRKSDYKSEADLRAALQRFNRMSTSTVKGAKSAFKKAMDSYSKTAGREVTAKEANAIGNIWEGIRQIVGRYEASRDETIQELILRGQELGATEDEINEIIREILEQDDLPLDEWESYFDIAFEDMHAEEDSEEYDEEDY